jgi:hypothetical protein
VTSGRVSTPIPTITVRLSTDEKARFAQLAASRGISESTLALTTIRLLLVTQPLPLHVPQPADVRESATERITIRLRPGDCQAIYQRATRRGFKSSAYLAALVRAHVSHNPPLPEKEIALLKQGIGILSRLSQLMAHMARTAARDGGLPPELAERLSQTRGVATALERCMHDLAKAALVAWESRYD